MGAVGSVLSGFIGPIFAIVMSNMIDVFYYRDAESMERKTKEYVFIFVGTGIYAVVAYLIQHYFFSIMGENLTTRVRRMMLAGIEEGMDGVLVDADLKSQRLARNSQLCKLIRKKS